MIPAVCPVAFWAGEHIELTRDFLWRLCVEGIDAVVYHNGGPLAARGWDMLRGCEARVVDAQDWPFFRMWNRGIKKSRRHDEVLVLNNDIYWEPGALVALHDHLKVQPPDVAIVSPNPEGEPRHCFAIRSRLAVHVDERYLTWWGDVELEYGVKERGLRCVQFNPGITHPHIQTTTDHIPGIHDMRLADEALFKSRWVVR